MHFIALVSGIVYILLSRPTADRPPLVELPEPQAIPRPPAEQVRACREHFIHELLQQDEDATELHYRRRDDLVPLHKAYDLLKEVAVELIDENGASTWPDLQPDIDFAFKLAVIVSTIKKHFGLNVEPASIGAELFGALEGEDFCKVADMHTRIVRDTTGVSDEDKSHYLFFMFWPQRYSQFMRGVH